MLKNIKNYIASFYSIVNDFSNWHDDVYGQLQEKPKKNPTNKPGLTECEIITILLLFLKANKSFLSIFIIILNRIIKNFFQKC